MTRSESIAKLAAALAKAQGEIEVAIKESKNPHFGNRYADLAALREAYRKALAANEIAIIQSPSADSNLIRMTTMLMHSSGEWVESDALQVQSRDAGPQAVGSCLTYLRRYQLSAMLGIVSEEDDDAEASEGRPVAKAPVVAKTPITANPKDKRVWTGPPVHAAGGIPEPPPITDKDIPF